MGEFNRISVVIGILLTARLHIYGHMTGRASDSSEEEAAREWLNLYNRKALDMFHNSINASWEYSTNITEHNRKIQLERLLISSEFQKNMSDIANSFDWRNFNDTGLQRQFRFTTDIGFSGLADGDQLKEIMEIQSDMETIYSTAKVCLKSDDNCLQLEPGLVRLLASSHDYEELLRAWKGWRDVTGMKMRDKYERFVKLSNEAIRSLGEFADVGEYMLSSYESPSFEEDIVAIMEQIKPLYLEIHTYVREKLQQVYHDHKFPATGHIPAHLLGNMWAQSWENLYNIMQPFKNKTSLDVTEAMLSQNYSVSKMFKVTEEFFASIGLPNMNEKFWKNSMLERPDDREVTCHASAWDFLKYNDYRIKMCTDITMNDLYIIHHEMGHIYYQIAYEDQPLAFRDGANPGFHEAVGDTIAMSVVTPEHLYKIGLLKTVEKDHEIDLNFLMKMALDKIVFMPFGFTMDSWRWGVFRGDTPPNQYNTKWWELRCKYQGLSPPVERSEMDFDPGAKYHIPFQVPYIRYFVANVLQFQFQKVLCEAAGHKGPLYRCDIYNSTMAGDKLRELLSLGKSKPWPEALEVMTGRRNMDASALMEYFQPLIDWLKLQNKGKRSGWEELACPSPTSGLIDSEEAGMAWLARHEKMAETLIPEMGEAEWQYSTNITDYNEKVKVAANLKYAEFRQSSMRNASMFDWRNFNNTILHRLFSYINDLGINALEDKEKLGKYRSVISEMKAISSRANVCLSDGQCHQMEPGLTKLFMESRNHSLLSEAWKKWRDATGYKMKEKYTDMVNISNEAITQLGYEDTGEYWRSWYESPTLQENLNDLLKQLQPLYRNLHAYVRRKLRDFYGKEHFPASGHIPAHLLGNMWGQQWNNIYDLVEPFKGKSSLDITPKLKALNLKAIDLFEIAEEFYTSLGLLKMPASFWNGSMFTKPDDRDVICHASAWDFYNGKDFRIKMCTKVDMEDLMTIHHEMGHIQYFMQYSGLPTPFRKGANFGFHEAVGDVMELSVSTPEHLNKIGLLDDVVQDTESDINFLMSMALKKIAFLPYGYLIDQWRWSVFSGETTPNKYNEKWWQLRCKLQGMSAPVTRTDDDFDPGAKYHVASNTPYIRYFVSFVVQFQFHQALCTAAGHTGPLHHCDIYQSKEAGRLLGDMLRAGSSRPWQEAMEKMTGQREMNAKPLMEYFRPLTDWLKEQNRNETIGWSEGCPESVLSNDVELAKELLTSYNRDVQKFDAYYMSAHWNYSTNLTDYNRKRQVEIGLHFSEFGRTASLNASKFNWKNFSDAAMRTQFSLITDPGVMEDGAKTKELSNIKAEMDSIYSKAEACLTADRCLRMEPDLEVLMSTSRNETELSQGWRAWRNATGRKIKDHYARFVELSNEGAKENGYEDTGDYWRSWYDTPSFRDDLVSLLDRLQVLYLQLHTYVRGRLEEYYGSEHFPRSGHIPAHLTGNMWAQTWANIHDLVQPFKDKEVPDITRTMKEKNYTADHMFRLAEEFFVSLNLSAMPMSFWEKSMLERPTDGREVVCHASAWDFGDGKDFRIKMCTDISFDMFQIIHHEMGHVQYYLQYKDQPWLFRRGANPGFHEAVGDIMAMSVVTPTHLHKLHLLRTVEDDYESDINFLMTRALQKIAFLPFGYLIDQWRWSVFSGETTPEEYNEKWWQLRCTYQGISPPGPRSNEDFDPGAKYHIPGNTPYIRYFISYVIQFQFQKALCDAAGHTGPLHKCDIYHSKDAGKLLGDMLKLGSSKPWPDAMEAITGQRSMSVEPLIEYFQPLIDWLAQQNAGKPIGWSNKCQQPRSSLIKDEDQARQWMESYNRQAKQKVDSVSELNWKYMHNVTSETSYNLLKVSKMNYAGFRKEAWQNASKFYWENFVDKELGRQFRFVHQDVGIDDLAVNPEKHDRLNSLIAEMDQIYTEGNTCFTNNKCLQTSQEKSASSCNYDQMAECWRAWHSTDRDTLTNKYAEVVQLSNEAVSELGYSDTGEYQRSRYESDTLQQDQEKLWIQIQPLYEQLHAYVRRQFQKVYGADQFPASGQIPTHLLGDVWGENWRNLYDMVMPYKGVGDNDVTRALQVQNYTAVKIFRKAEDLFTSMGLPKLPPSFWERSTFTQPVNGRNLSCNPAILDLGSDIRVSVCTNINMEDFVYAHKELAGVHYSTACSDQPFSLQGTANPGFREAVTGLVALSASSPIHLQALGLLDKANHAKVRTVNSLMKMALEKITFLPYDHISDLWQWSVFRGETSPDNYHDKWWQLRCKYQGLSPPEGEMRGDVFLAGTKFQVSSDTPNIRSFVGAVLEFQLYEGLCAAAGHTGPLHMCDLYGSKRAGALLHEVTESGRSKPWPQLLETVTGQQNMDATSLVKYFQPLLDWLKEQNKDQSVGWEEGCAAQTIGKKASDWLKSFNREAAQVYNKRIIKAWNYSVNITSTTGVEKTVSLLEAAVFDQESAKVASTFPWAEIKDTNTSRQLRKITDIGTSAMKDKMKLRRLNNIQSRMQGIYSKGSVCVASGRCLSLEPGLTDLMATSRNQTLLLKAWKGWRDKQRHMKPLYMEFVDLSNEAIRDLGYSDTGEYWRSSYEIPTFVSDLEGLLMQLSPLYENLHAYVRRRLMGVYGGKAFPSTGHIPAHLLGNMWSQNWGNIYSLVIPYNSSQGVDITPELRRQRFTVKRLFQTAEEFFVSLGLAPLPASFWNRSMLEKPVGRDVVCHASAWDMLNQSDVRIKMCTSVNMDNLFTVHHELGHVQYYLQYRDQPIKFRRGANPGDIMMGATCGAGDAHSSGTSDLAFGFCEGFHEAVGDVLSLSVSTPKHLRKIGLLNTHQDDYRADINFLMMMALEKIAFLPFGYLIDQWRWSVFSGETTAESYNEKWWEIRCKYQGVSPPVDRSDEDFDPGAKYHIPANSPYIRYFISYVIQFQFHKALCDAAGHTGPLHKCDIYQSKEAGRLLGDMLRLGSSIPWPEAMKKLTGQSKIDAGPLLEYFTPLNDWLQTENHRERTGWVAACPSARDTALDSKHSNFSGTIHKTTSIVWYLFVAIFSKILIDFI